MNCHSLLFVAPINSIRNNPGNIRVSSFSMTFIIVAKITLNKHMVDVLTLESVSSKCSQSLTYSNDLLASFSDCAAEYLTNKYIEYVDMFCVNQLLLIVIISFMYHFRKTQQYNFSKCLLRHDVVRDFVSFCVIVFVRAILLLCP